MATTALGTCEPTPTTVLLIDADAAWLRVMSKYLKSFFRVVVASDDQSAIQALAHHRVDVVVTDATLGFRTAAHLHTAIARLCPGLEKRIVFTTCGGFDDGQRAFFDRVGNPVLYKSVDVARLRMTIEGIATRAVH